MLPSIAPVLSSVSCATHSRSKQLSTEKPGNSHSTTRANQTRAPTSKNRIGRWASPLQHLEALPEELRPPRVKVLLGIGQLRGVREEEPYQLPVVLGPYLLGEEQPARPQHAPQLRDVIVAMPVRDDVEALVGKGDPVAPVCLPEGSGRASPWGPTR